MRVCHYCGLEIEDDEEAIEARMKNAWAHFTCWYDGGPFERETRGIPAEISALRGRA